MRRLSEASGVQELIDGLTYQILLVDADYHIHAYNKSTAQAFGKAFTTKALQHCHAVVYHSEKPHEYCPLPEVLKTGREAHKMVRAPDGTWNRISIYPTDLTTEAGERLYLHTIRDASQIMKDSLELVLQDELLSRVGESIFVFDKQGAFHYANRAAYEDRGYTEEEFLKLNLKDINLPERADFVKERIEETWQKGKAAFDNICLRKDGSTFPVEVEARKFHFADLEGIISVVRDITERKRAEEALREKEAMKNFGMLADNAHDGVLVLSGDKGKIVYANRRIARMTGYTRSELVSIDTREILRPVEIKSLKDRYLKRLKSKSMPRTYESFLVNKHREHVPIEVSASKTSWYRQPAIVALFRDIRDRKKTEELLREKQIMENFKLLVGNTNDGVLVTWGKGVFDYANNSMARLTGYTVEELTSMGLPELVHPDEIERVREIFAKRMAGASIPQTYESVIVKKSGENLPVEATGAKTIWKGKPATVVTYRDISGRKAMEDTLSKQYALLNAILESNTGPVFSADTEGRYTSFNTAHSLAMKNGYGANIELGKSLFDYMTVAEDRKKGEKILRRVLKGETFSEETYYGDEAHNRRYYKLLYSPIKDQEGKVVGGSAFTEDITSQKLVEEALQEKETMENFKWLADNAHDAILVLSGRPERYVFANKRAVEITGYSRHEFASMGIKDFVHRDYVKRIKDRYRKRIAGEPAPTTYEMVLVKKNGESFPIETTAAKTVWYGQPADVVIFRDITDRKQIERMLREQKIMENFKSLVTNANDGVLVTWGAGEFVYANKQMARMTGYSIDELTSMGLPELVHPDELKRIRAVYAKRVAGVPIPQTHETVIVKKSGENLPVEVTGAKTVWQDKPATVVTFRDISRRKAMEDTLSKQHALINGILESNKGPIFSVDRKYEYTSFNSAHAATMKKIYGVDIKLGGSILDYMTVDEDKAIAKANIDRALKGEQFIEEAFSGKTELNRLYFEVLHNPIRDAQGKIVGVSVYARDVSDRKAAEEEIRLVSTLLESSVDTVFVHDEEGHFYYVNEAAYKDRGYTKEELMKMNLHELDTPEQARQIELRIKKMHAQKGAKKSLVFESAHFRKDGSVMPVEVHASFIKWQDKNLVFSHIIDLTERKVAEETIERERDTVRNYLDIAQVMIVAINTSGKVAMINTYGADLLGYPVETIVGENWFENFLPRDEKDNVREVFNRISKDGLDNVEIVQNNIVSSDGTKHLIRWHNTYVKDKDGNLLYTLSSGEDVTEVVESQAKLSKSYARLEHIIDGIIGALATTVETRDPYTANHQRRVAQLSVAIAGKLGWGAEDQKVLESAAMIHDIGKMYVSVEVLNKPGKLDSLEFELIKLHPASAYEILKNIDFAGSVAKMVRQHHERLDGSGYPDGLKDKQIDPGARIMAVADVVEAMASDRPYRPSCGLDAALKEVQDRKGELYDKKAVDACVALFMKDNFSFD